MTQFWVANPPAVKLLQLLTCANRHVAAPGPVLGAGPDGGAVLLHPVARLALEADVLADGEVFAVAEAVGGHSRVAAVYHLEGEGEGGEGGSQRGQTYVSFLLRLKSGEKRFTSGCARINWPPPGC